MYVLSGAFELTSPLHTANKSDVPHPACLRAIYNEAQSTLALCMQLRISDVFSIRTGRGIPGLYYIVCC